MKSVRYLKNVSCILLVVICMTIFPYGYAVTAQPISLRLTISSDSNVLIDRIIYNAVSRMGISVTIDPLGMVSGIEGANSGTLYDGICAQAARMEQQYPNLVMVPEPSSTTRVLAFTKQDNTKTISGWGDLSGMRVGALAQKPYVLSKLPADVTAVQKDTWSDLTEALTSGECEVILTTTSLNSGFVAPETLKQAGMVEELFVYPYLNVKHSDLVQPFAEALRAVKADGTRGIIENSQNLTASDIKSVVYLSSYSQEMEWEQRITEGIGSVFNDEIDVHYSLIALNSLRLTNRVARDELAMKTIRAIFCNNLPDAVIVSDNEALEFVNEYYNVLFVNIPIVFCGIDAYNPSMLGGIKNITGITDTLSAAATAEEMLRMFPGTKSIYVISDFTHDGLVCLDKTLELLKPFEDRVTVSHNENVSSRELFDTVANLPEDTLILCAPYFVDSTGYYYAQAEFQTRLASVAKVPIFGLFDTSVGMGQIGGRYNSGYGQGAAAAKMVMQIIKQGNLPAIITDNEMNNKWIFDKTVLDRFGVDMAGLPASAEVINREIPFYESDPAAFFIGILLIAGLLIIVIIYMFFNNKLKKRNTQLLETQQSLAVAQAQSIENEKRAIEIKNRLQQILETAPISYSLTVNDEVVEYNRYYKERIGLPEGGTVMSKYKDNAKNGAVEYKRVMEQLKNEGALHNVLWNIPEKDGSYHRYLFSLGLAEYNGNQAVMFWGSDIEELERQRDALNRAYEDMRNIIDSTPIPIAVLNPVTESMKYVNSEWYKLFNVGDSETDAISEIVRKNNIDDMAKEAMHSDQLTTWEQTFVNTDGGTIDTEVSAKRIKFVDEDCLIISHRDLSEERRRAQLLMDAADKEREANRLKSHFLMNMSHEIRTPMNAIIGMTHIAKSAPDTAMECIGNIEKATAHLLGIINNVLDLSLIEDGKLTLKTEEVSIVDVADSIVSVMQTEGQAKNITIDADFTGVTNKTVICDGARLGQIMLNLLSNAIKYSEDGGCVSFALTEQIIDDDSSSFSVVVKDNGCGIPQDKINRLFKPFEQADDSITRRYGGAGMGLAICKNIADLMGGTITVDTVVDVGSTFVFTLTVPVVKEEALTDKSCAYVPDFSAMRVLIVDDVDINRMIASELFGELGLTIEEAENGKQALEMVQNSSAGYYDFVLMDVQMPVMDGCTSVKEIRALDREDTKKLPIIAMTANVMQADIDLVIEAGMDGHIGKPIDFDVAVETITAVLCKNKAF